MAGLDEKFDVGIHERYGHSNGGAVGKNEVRVLAETLDHGEDVIPSSAVQAGRVVAKFVDDLLSSKLAWEEEL